MSHGLRTPTVDSPPFLRYGFPDYTTVASPAAGADLTVPIDGRYFERLLTVWCRLVTSSDVAAREVVLQYQSPEGSIFRQCGAATTVPADSTYDYSFSVWQPLTEFPVDTGILVNADPIIIPPTFKWALHVVNKSATDQLSRVRVFRERFFSDSPVPGVDYGADQ